MSDQRQTESPVNDKIIRDIAQKHPISVDKVRDVLDRVGPEGDLTTDSLADERTINREAGREALEVHGEAQAQTLRDNREGEMVFSVEFDVPVEIVQIHDPFPDDVLRDVWPVEVEKPNGVRETTSMETLVTEQMDPDNLDVGDRFQHLDGTILDIVGVASAEELSEGALGGPMYETKLREDRADESQTVLYGPSNIRLGLEAGAVYAGRHDVEEERTPFWCEGCGYPCKSDERYEPLDEPNGGDVCSAKCKNTVIVERQKATQIRFER